MMKVKPLIKLQDRFLEYFFFSPIGPQFYLTSGTALARFYFNHRDSLDLDFFTNDQEQDFDFVNRIILRIVQDLSLIITNQVVTSTYLQYIFSTKRLLSLKVDIVKDIPVHFGEVQSKGVLRIDSLENIGSNKILAVFGRTDAKDFIDLYWIFQKTHLNFETLFNLAKQKDFGLSELYFAFALQNIKQISHFPQMSQPLFWDEIVTYFLGLSQRLLFKIKPEE